MARSTIELFAALSERPGRQRAADALAVHLGASALYAFVPDVDLGALVPAPGFAATLPGGPGWRALLEQARSPGLHRGQVQAAPSGQVVPAVALAYPGLVLVLVGTHGAAVRDELDVLAPLLAGILRAEHAEFAAQGQVRVARNAAEHSSALALALDRTRTDLERTLSQLESQAHSLEEARRSAEEAQRAAEQAARVKDEFLAMLGHELRNPLAPIFTAIQLLRMRGELSREHEVIERQVVHVMRLVDDLLDVSRITRGKVRLERQRVELSEVTARAIEMACPLLEERRQRLAMAVPARGLVVHGDPSRLAQVVSNLLTNAARYSPVASQVTVRADRCGATVRLAVEDEGIGIEPAMLKPIFHQFVQGGEAGGRAEGGLGLGLAIVRSLVGLHGGRVWAESEGPGTGSRFVVELPACEETALDEPAGGASGPEAGHQSLRVLVVDDNEDAAGLLAQVLEALGYSTRTAPDGPTALEVAAAFDPEVALLDIGLPVMDGYELAGRLRASRPGRPLRLIAVTGYGQESDRARSRDAGFEAHLVKPVDLAALRRVMEQPALAG